MSAKVQHNFLMSWLTTESVPGGVYEGQDGPWCIASNCTVVELLDAAVAAGAIPYRRDLILYAIGIDLELLLAPDEQEYKSADLLENTQALLDFAAVNWEAFQRIELKFGFSADFDEHVRPAIERLTKKDKHSD